MGEGVSMRPECEVCFTIHKENVPLSFDGGCLCCQADHKPTCDCGQPGIVDADPFNADVNNDDEPCILCEDCAYERAMDI